MKFSAINSLQQIPGPPSIRNKVTDAIMALAIPFNRFLGLKIEDLSTEKSRIVLPDRSRRKNHVGGAHACALALLGEYCAGLVLAQNYPPNNYRLIIGKLSVDYHKQGRGKLTGTSSMETSPKISVEGTESEFWHEMTTEIVNAKSESVATVYTKWQLKEWSAVKKKKTVS